MTKGPRIRISPPGARTQKQRGVSSEKMTKEGSATLGGERKSPQTHLEGKIHGGKGGLKKKSQRGKFCLGPKKEVVIITCNQRGGIHSWIRKRS